MLGLRKLTSSAGRRISDSTDRLRDEFLRQDPPATLSRSDCGLGDPTTLHLALAPLPIKGIDSSADFSLDSFLFQILALIAMGLSTPDTEFQLHSMIFPIKAEGD